MNTQNMAVYSPIPIRAMILSLSQMSLLTMIDVSSISISLDFHSTTCHVQILMNTFVLFHYPDCLEDSHDASITFFQNGGYPWLTTLEGAV
jgi:hypothetical protein